MCTYVKLMYDNVFTYVYLCRYVPTIYSLNIFSHVYMLCDSCIVL